jgi:hypothetical protein
MRHVTHRLALFFVIPSCSGVRFRDRLKLPLQEEGIYRFGIGLTSQEPVFVDVPVLSLARRPAAELH